MRIGLCQVVGSGLHTYFLHATEGFVPSHAPLKNNKHLNIPFQSTQLRRGKDKSESQGLPMEDSVTKKVAMSTFSHPLYPLPGCPGMTILVHQRGENLAS